MTHYKKMIDTEYLGQWDLPPGKTVVVTIAKVEPYVPEKRRSVKGKPEKLKRIKITLANGKGDLLRKPWLSGPVTQATIAKLYGPHVENWIGKKIALYVDPDVAFGGDVTGGLRVKPTKPTGAATTEALDNAPPPEKLEQLEAAARQVSPDGFELPPREPGSDDA